MGLFPFARLPMNIDHQTEKAFQKQPTVFLHKNRRVLAKKSKAGVLYYKDVGLGFKTPKTAIEGAYIDKKCPFTGNVSIRGRILRGIVASTKMNKTIIVRKNFPLLEEVQPLREATHQHCRSLVPRLPCQGR